MDCQLLTGNVAYNTIMFNHLNVFIRNPIDQYTAFMNFWMMKQSMHIQSQSQPSWLASLIPYHGELSSDEEEDKKMIIKKVNDFMIDTILSHASQKNCCHISERDSVQSNGPAVLLPTMITSSVNAYDDPKMMENVASRSAETRNGKFVCYVCKRSFTRRYALKVHFRSHTGYKPLHCTKCNKSFKDPSNFNKHQRIHK